LNREDMIHEVMDREDIGYYDARKRIDEQEESEEESYYYPDPPVKRTVIRRFFHWWKTRCDGGVDIRRV